MFQLSIERHWWGSDCSESFGLSNKCQNHISYFNIGGQKRKISRVTYKAFETFQDWNIIQNYMNQGFREDFFLNWFAVFCPDAKMNTFLNPFIHINIEISYVYTKLHQLWSQTGLPSQLTCFIFVKRRQMWIKISMKIEQHLIKIWGIDRFVTFSHFIACYRIGIRLFDTLASLNRTGLNSWQSVKYF